MTDLNDFQLFTNLSYLNYVKYAINISKFYEAIIGILQQCGHANKDIFINDAWYANFVITLLLQLSLTLYDVVVFV